VKRTLIVTIETSGEDEYRAFEEAEQDLPGHCNNADNSQGNCS
jgi:hypothetical protein